MLPCHFIIHICLFVSICWRTLLMTAAHLLFPNNTVLQLTSSISVPIVDLPPHRSILWDWGVQMNYNLPFELLTYSNVPIWPTEERDARSVRSQRFDKVAEGHLKVLNNNETFNAWIDELGNKHIFDFTAGELYRAIERLLESYDFHSSCLQQSVCDLAKHPFGVEQRHLITDLITFILSPSWHLGFVLSEDAQRIAYEAAEKSGTRGLNCKKLYPSCRKNLLHVLTYVVFELS